MTVAITLILVAVLSGLLGWLLHVLMTACAHPAEDVIPIYLEDEQGNPLWAQWCSLCDEIIHASWDEDAYDDMPEEPHPA